MAEERVVRLRLERVGFDEAEKGSQSLEQKLDKLAGAEQRLGREAKPAAASVAKLAQEEGKAGTAAGAAAPKVDKLGTEIAQTGKQAATAGGQMDKLGGNMRGLGGITTSLARQTAGLAAAYLSLSAIRNVASFVIETAASYEQLRAKLETVTGSADNAEQAFGFIKEFAKSTPFEVDSITEAFIRLQASGIDPTAELLRALGDHAASWGRDISDYAQAVVSATVGETEALKSFGVVAKVEGDKLAVSFGGQTTEIERNAEAIVAHLQKIGAENYAGGMDKQAATAAGAFSNLNDAAAQAADTIGRGGLLDAVAELTRELTDMLSTAETQAQLVETGRELGGIVREISAVLRDLDTAQIAKTLDLAVSLAATLASVLDTLNDIGQWMPSSLLFNGLINGAVTLRDEVRNAAEAIRNLPQRMDPRAAAGAAGALPQSGRGMTDAERKAWDEAEAGAARDHQRYLERQKEKEQRAASAGAAEAKRLDSAREAAKKLVDAIEEEARQRGELLAILAREGESRDKLAKEFREAEIAQKADAKIREIRAAYLKAELKFTDANAAAIRRWIIEAEKADDRMRALGRAVSEMRSLGGPIDTSSLDDAIKKREAEIKEYKDSIAAIDEANQASLDEHSQAIYDDLIDQAANFKDSLRTPKQELQEFNRYLDMLGEVTDSTGRKILDQVEIERARAQATESYYSQQIDAWAGFLQQLGSELGGFFSYLAQAASAIQNVNSTAQSLGGWQSVAGAFGGTVAAFAAVYSYADAIIKKNDSKKYGTRGSVDRTSGLDVYSFSGGGPEIENASLELARSIRSAIDALEDALRISIDDLPAIELRVSNDGKKVQAWIAGVYYNTFADVNEAIRAATIKALQDTGGAGTSMSGLMLEGLQDWTSPDTEGLMEFLQQLRAISDISLGPLGAQLQQSVQQFNRLREALLQLDQSSAAVIQAHEELTRTQLDMFEQIKAQLLGIDLSAAEALRSLAGLQTAMPAAADSMRGSLERAMEAAQRRLDQLERQATGLPNSGMGGAGAAGPREDPDADPITTQLFSASIDDERAKLRAAIEEYKKQLGELPRALSAQEIDLGVFTALEKYLRQSKGHADLIQKYERMRIETEFEAIRLQLVVLGAWERWADVWNELYQSAMSGAGRAPRGGGGGRDRKSERDDLRDEIARIQAELRGPVHAAFFDFQQQLEDFKERAKESKLSAADLAAGVAALTEQFRRSLRQQAETWAGRGTDFSRRLREMQDFFDSLRDLGKGSGMGRRQIDRLEGEALSQFGAELQLAIASFGGLVNPMLAINTQAADLRENLLAYAAAAGWSAEQIAEAMAAIDAGVDYQRQQGINSLMDRLFAWMQQAGIQTQESVEHERTKALLDLQIIQAQLQFYGALTAQVQGWIDDVRDWINSPDFGLDRAADDLSRAARDLSASSDQIADAWRRAVQDWRSAVQAFSEATQDLMTNDELSGLTQEQQLEAARQRMLDLVARARTGDVDALRALAQAREEFLAESRESNQGGSAYLADWQIAMKETAELLQDAQSIETNVALQAAAQIIAGGNSNTDDVTTAVYQGAAQVVAAIYRMMNGLPAYGEGGYVDRPHLAIVGDRPEYILPAVPGIRGPGTVAVVHGTPSSARADATLDKMLREQRRHTPALRSTAYSSGSTARASRELVDAETRSRVVSGRKR